jgi:hypothetical protein
MRELDDLRGRLRVEAGAQGACGTYEAMVFSGLLVVWGDGHRTEPVVECGLRRLSGALGLSWGRTHGVAAPHGDRTAQDHHVSHNRRG